MDELDRILHQAGIAEPPTQAQGPLFGTTLGESPILGDRDRGVTTPPPVTQEQHVQARGGGFLTQMGEGFTTPFTIIPRKTGLMEDEHTKPMTTGEHVGRFVGSLFGWGLVGAVTTATLGKGTAALAFGATTAAKGGVGVSMTKYGVSGIATGALSGVEDDLPPGEIAKRAGFGGAFSAAIPGALHLTRGVRADMMNKLLQAKTDFEWRHLPRHARPDIYGKKAITEQVRGMSREGAQDILSEFKRKHGADLPGFVKHRKREAQWGKMEEVLGNLSPRQAKERFGRDFGAISRMEKLTPQEELAVITDSLWNEQSAYRNMLKPILRPAIKSAYKTRKFALSSEEGLPLSRELKWQQALLGRAEGNPDIARHMPDVSGAERVAKMPLQEQLGWTQRRISNLISKRHDLWAKTGIAPARIKGAGESFRKYMANKATIDKAKRHTPKIQRLREENRNILDNLGIDEETMVRNQDLYSQYINNIRQVDQLETARYSLTSRVDKTLRLADRGIYQRALDTELEKEAMKLSKQYSHEAKYPVHDDLLQILKRNKVLTPDDLPAAEKKLYDSTKAMLQKRGETVEETYGYIMNNDMLFPQEVFEGVRSQVILHPDVKVPTAWDEAIRHKPPGIFEAMLGARRGVFGEATQRPLRVAVSSKKHFDNEWEGRVSKLTKGLTPEDRETITRWLWSENRPVIEKEFLREGKNWTPALKQKAQEADKLFLSLSKQFDIDPATLKQHYAPRVRANMWRFEHRGQAVPDELSFFAEEQRTGHLLGKEVDIDALLRAYIRSGSKKKFLDPAFKMTDKRWNPKQYLSRIRKEAKDFLEKRNVSHPKYLSEKDKRTYERMQKEVKEFSKDMAKRYQRAKRQGFDAEYYGMDGGRVELYEAHKRGLMGWSSETENLVNNTLNGIAKTLFGKDTGRNWTKEITSFLASMQYQSTLGWNLFSPIKNLTQQIIPVATLDDNPLVGVRYWAKAMRYLSSQKGRNFSAMTNANLTNRVSHQALADQYAVARKYPLAQKVMDKGFTGFKASDRTNVSVSHMMKMLYELDRGAHISDAVESAYTFTMSSQYMYGMDSPMLYEGDLGRMLGVLMSWPMNFAHMLREHGSVGAYQKAANVLGAYAFGSQALSASGISFASIHPAQTAEGLLPVAMLEGSDSSPLMLRTVNSTFNYVRALAGGDPEAMEWAKKDFARQAGTFVPFMTQIRRIDNFVDMTLSDDIKYERDYKQRLMGRDPGRIQYEAAPEEKWRGLIGPTTESQERWKQMQMVSREQSIYRDKRKRAMDALFEGDMEGFMRLQDELVTYFGKGIEAHEVERELEQYRIMDSLERRAMGLPKEYREQLLERYGAFRQDREEALPVPP